MSSYDAIIIGSGQAGNPLAEKLADHGWSVALIEKGPLGGTCINVGCTPTKTMVASAMVAHYARQAARWGVHAGPVSVEMPRIVERKEKVVEQWRSGLEKKMAARKNVHLFHGHARFVEPHRVRVGDDTLDSERIFINAGARPVTPRLEGLESVGYLDNASIMQLQEVPEHLLVLGGGYVGLEFGQMFRRFGSRVTIVQRSERIVPREDPDVTQELQKALEAEGIRFVVNADATRVERQAGEVVLSVRIKAETEALRGTHLLVAIGRRPNTDDLGVEQAGIALDRGGNIVVNDRLETSVPGVWALGDIKGGPAFTHISYNDYQVVYANLVQGRNVSVRDRLVPYAVYTDPQLGRVGLTETEARATRRKLKIGKISMSWVARAIERDETAGLMKVIIDAATDRILGAAVLGVEGGEIVQILGAAMLAQAPYTLLKGAIYIHPTLAEGLWTLMDQVKPE